ncbi:MAG: hypothetical protein E6124_24990 [Blautia producta]|uniref:hypothetical protein n=1 Tax=Blautia producta TaxID=33035 RepID=UPI00290A2906|nr:hypothetical protein [Blautia producta]MDU5385421.1 hypothetical protein [Blautia producta]MDU6881583.1 hypothetical protein [Blautia producta]
MKTDIFEDMVELAGCNFISDLPYSRKRVLEELKKLPPHSYPKEQLEKFSHYVFGVDYAVIMGILEMKKGSDRPCRKCESTF